MSADVKKAAKLEPQPLKPISMPEYRYQDRVISDYTSADQSRKAGTKDSVDLRGISLNLA